MKFNWRFKGAYTAKRKSKHSSILPQIGRSPQNSVEKRFKEGRKRLRLRSNGDDDDAADACALCWDNVVPKKALFNQLSAEAKLLWRMHGGDRGSAKSFWISRTTRPKCALELFAQRIASFHCTRAGGEGHFLLISVLF